VPTDGISTVTVEGGAVKAVSGTGHQPAWRGTADVLRVETATGKSPGLCLSAADGSNARAVTTPAAAEGPAVSWDGTQLAVRAGVGSPKVSLVVGPVDTPVRRVILDGADITGLTWLGNSYVVACLTPPGAAPRIVKVPLAGGASTKVRDGCPGPASGSPDGGRVAIPTTDALEVVETSGKVITLPRAGLLQQPPAWSPGSDRLTYGYADEQGRALGLFDITNSIANQIARAEADQPAFSPKADRILFTGRTTAGGPRQILSVAPTGGAVKVIASCSGRCMLPRSAWAPDGATVVVDSTPGA
jgi:hypothetical protein